MSWAEEQDWFGTEDIFLEVLRDAEEDKFFLKKLIIFFFIFYLPNISYKF